MQHSVSVHERPDVTWRVFQISGHASPHLHCKCLFFVKVKWTPGVCLSLLLIVFSVRCASFWHVCSGRDVFVLAASLLSWLRLASLSHDITPAGPPLSLISYDICNDFVSSMARSGGFVHAEHGSDSLLKSQCVCDQSCRLLWASSTVVIFCHITLHLHVFIKQLKWESFLS